MIKVLGADGSYSHKGDATSFLIEKNIVIDAGNIIKSMGEECCKIEHVFITHTHFDHIVDLPFIIDSYFNCRTKPLKVYALKENLDTLKQYLFNWNISPNFANIKHINNEFSLKFIPIEYGQTITVDNIKMTAVKANHTVPTCGFKVEKEDRAFLFSGDTYLNDELIALLNNDKNISSLLIDISLPSTEEDLAHMTKHLTPKLLEQMFSSLERDDVSIYTYHQKPRHTQQIDNELSELDLLKNGGKRLKTGDILDLFTPMEKRQSTRNLELYYNDRNYLSSLFKLLQAIPDNTVDRIELFENILEHAMNLTHADAASLYLANTREKALQCGIFSNNTLKLKASRATKKNAPVYAEYMKLNSSLLSMFDTKKEAFVSNDIYTHDTSGFEEIKMFDQKTGYRTQSIVMEPVLDQKNNLLGILQVMNKRNIYNETIAFDTYDQESIKTFALQLSSAVENAKTQKVVSPV
ncbi:MBL fold metallo-hydrolase [Sulfurovum sp. NBC37-1]|uniref:MBL fold metallo-hydrolase n=1 Tax=Sulfurovum sp. (strain NBC37-1) TaxID=387093 RepID=UPI0001587B77|nr:MBL fold metallo-hydrolase [Sulfurovum sp. NBC37-1]BAF72803.1 conserved hypothetical protein [Sulfurovum sp. NBC37-1]